ncbi:hypothetical protein Tco_0088036 [Tanacetum coccineum]
MIARAVSRIDARLVSDLENFHVLLANLIELESIRRISSVFALSCESYLHFGPCRSIISLLVRHETLDIAYPELGAGANGELVYVRTGSLSICSSYSLQTRVWPRLTHMSSSKFDFLELVNEKSTLVLHD